MIKHEINCVLNEYTSEELNKNQQDLLQKAHEKQSKKILEAKECVLNAVKNAKSLLAKS